MANLTVGLENLDDFVASSLKQAASYHLDESAASIKLDQNEFPEDLPDRLKSEIAQRLTRSQWNRYPKPFTPSLTKLLSESLDVSPDCLLTGPGSDHLITLIYQTLLPKKADASIHVLIPSFPLYATYLQAINRPFKSWYLKTDDLSFDLSYAKNFKPGDLVCLATPNNPSSTAITYSQMESLLKNYSQTLFVVDEAYFEFADQEFLPLTKLYANIILLRTFSKTAALAGMRFGYLVAHKEIVVQLKKLRLPYMLNQFSITGVEHLLKSSEYSQWKEKQLALVRSERQRMTQLYREACAGTPCSLVGGVANFFILRWETTQLCESHYQHWLKNGVQVRNVSKAPLMEASLRVSIGKASENSFAYESFCKFLNQNPQREVQHAAI